MKPVKKFAELSVNYKITTNIDTLPVISSSKDAYTYMHQFYPSGAIALREYFYVAYLNRANKVLAVYQASVGGISSTVVDPRLILGIALKIAACSVILSHNHPSGNIKPSTQDVEITKRIHEGAKLLDISLLDHVIVGPGPDKYLSFADEGLL